MPSPRDGRPAATRRRVLVAVGTGLSAGLAGCAGRFDDVDELLGEDEPTYDTAALRALGEKGVPRPPATFPVSIPDAAVERHRKRARELLDAVPADPGETIPNGAVAAEIEHERQHVVESLRGDDDSSTRRDRLDRLDRLDHWRYVRAEAAAVRGTYRAATSDVDPAAVGASRDRLRSDLYGFLDGWEYRGADPVSALVVHRAIEQLVESVRGSTRSEGPLPSNPVDDVSRFGSAFRDLESGRAALGDAERIRRRYVDAGGDAVTAYRDAIAGTFHQMRTTLHATARGADEYANEPNVVNPPFDRGIEGTPAERVYELAVRNYDWRNRSLDRARHRGKIATGVLGAGRGLATKETLVRVVDAVRDGEYESPADAATVRDYRRRAVEGLQSIWNIEPASVSVELAEPASDGVRDAANALSEERVDRSEVNRAVAGFAYAATYADVVGAVVDHTVETLRSTA